MKNTEIIKALEDGATIAKIERMIFKRGKLVRGCTIEYYISGQRIKSNQFEAIEYLLTKVKPQEGSFTNYKLIKQ